MFTAQEYAQVISVSVMTFISIFTSSFALIVFYRKRSMWKNPNTYILLNMVIADALPGWFHFPISVYHLTQGSSVLYTPDRGVMCQITGLMAIVGVGVSLAMVTLLSTERYQAIVQQKEINLKATARNVLIFWFAPTVSMFVVIFVPAFPGLQVESSKTYCSVRMDDARNLILAVFWSAGIIFCWIVITFCYIRIIAVMRQVSCELKNLGVDIDSDTSLEDTYVFKTKESLSDKEQRKKMKYENAVMRKCAIVVGMFLCNTTPFLIAILYKMITRTNPPVLDTISVFFLVFHSAVNPVLVISLDPFLRAAAKDCLKDAKGILCRADSDETGKSVSTA